MQRTTGGDSQGSINLNPSFPAPVGTGLLPGQSYATPSAARTWPSLHELFYALKRRLVLATFLGILVGMAAAAAVWLAMPAGKHQARALVQVKPNNPLVGGGRGTDQEFDNFKQTQQTIIRTRRLLQRVTGNPKVARLNVISTSDDPVRYLEESIRIRWEAPEIMSVAMNGDDPQQLKIIIDTLINEYLEDSKSAEQATRTRRKADLEKLRDDLEKKILASSKKLQNITTLGVTPSVEGNAARTESVQLLVNRLRDNAFNKNNEIKDLTARISEDETQLQKIDSQPIDPADIEKSLFQDEFVKEKLAVRNKQVADLKKLATQVPESSPLYRSGQELVAKADAELKTALDGLRGSVESKYKIDRKRNLEVKLEQMKSTLRVSSKLLADYQAELKVLEDRLDTLNRGTTALIEADDIKPLKEEKNKIETELARMISTDRSEPRIVAMEDAVVILNQNLRQKLLLAAAAAIAGLGVIMASVAFLEWRSRRIDSVQQVIDELGIRVIGTIPAFPSKASLKSNDAAQTQNWRFVLNESVNSVRTMLLHTAKTQNMQVLMVSSAMQGEGKTSLASQLATSMASAGLRTLILDCDLRNPSLHKLFDAPLTPGCSEVLCQEVDVSDAVQPTTVPNLWLIAAGQCSNRVIASLAQGHPLETLFNRLRGQFDFIVVDSCPILPVADSLLVGQHVDGVVISVLQDISQLPKVMTASEKLTALNIPLLGAVVNGIKADVHAYGYNYVKQLPA